MTPLVQVFCKKGHCIHILWCILMGLGHNNLWVESHIRPQQIWGQRSSRGQWPLVQAFAKMVTVSKYFDVFSGETLGSRTTLSYKTTAPKLTILSYTECPIFPKGYPPWALPEENITLTPDFQGKGPTSSYCTTHQSQSIGEQNVQVFGLSLAGLG